jgi:hypothetical protein
LAARGAVHTVVWSTPIWGGDTEWGPILDVSVAQRHGGAERCFKCPKERRPGEPGWHSVDLDDIPRPMGPCRLYVCPEDYLDFAASERGRWAPVLTTGNGSNGDGVEDGSAPVHPETSTCTAEELIDLLGHRGLAGWAFLVRDVAAGRVRRVHLRQLPADPEIRQSLMAYLQSAGAAVTVSRSFLTQQRRFARG